MVQVLYNKTSNINCTNLIVLYTVLGKPIMFALAEIFNQCKHIAGCLVLALNIVIYIANVANGC